MTKASNPIYVHFVYLYLEQSHSPQCYFFDLDDQVSGALFTRQIKGDKNGREGCEAKPIG